MELWYNVDNYNYSVSSHGRIMNNTNMKILKGSINHDGYIDVGLTRHGKYKKFLLHRLIAIAFIDNSEHKPYVNHKDGNKLNNDISNLEWVTPKENVIHAWDTNLCSNFGDKHHSNVLTESNVTYIIENKGKKTYKELAELFNCSVSTIGSIYMGRTWKHLSR